MTDCKGMPQDAPKEPLDSGVKLFVGLLLPHCCFALLAYLCAPSGHDAAGGFAALGYMYAAWLLGVITFINTLCVISALSFTERLSAFLVACICPLIALLVLIAGAK